MNDYTLKALKKSGVHIPKCNCAKIHKLYKLSNEELISLENLKEASDNDSIKKFFLNSFPHLHTCGIEVIPDDTKLYPIRDFHLLVFAPHAYKVGQVLLVVIDQYVFEFTLKFPYKKLFIGGVTHALYAVFDLFVEDVKPVRVWQN